MFIHLAERCSSGWKAAQEIGQGRCQACPSAHERGSGQAAQPPPQQAAPASGTHSVPLERDPTAAVRPLLRIWLDERLHGLAELGHALEWLVQYRL
ncbi:hypothetical protein G3435_06205 [Pseudomonas sp. MAFF212428]|uniref:Uncharacterized protein n=1 Tax=Pseudomonas brassicae TaxID=2708063 RepID=A0A6M0CQ85_9PSED|nr:hypothetical protein [Pseudomonas brassicae]NER59696.1 hypothetical protein [Pseudomonas brassicae]